MASKPPKTLIIGAAGAVGKRLAAALSRAGGSVIAADRMAHVPSTLRMAASVCVGGIDVRDKEALYRLFRDHADEDTAVWNLASPLSVETALSPELAQAVVIGGMQNVLDAMKEVGCRRICFTDSIGSYGALAPREECTARWLVDNPTQDPGSDYGLQKRACRELLDDFARKDGGDPRIAILPGVLHAEPVWGNGTTECAPPPEAPARPTGSGGRAAPSTWLRAFPPRYALDAMLAASRGQPYTCPVEPEVTLPMVFADDLMRGLLALQHAREDELREPQRLYALPGLSFSPTQLFHEIRQHLPDFEPSVELNANMAKFARLWPDTLSTVEAERDLDYEAEVTLPRMVASVLNAHSGRRISSKAAFRSIDTCESGRVNDYMLERYVRKYLVRGRERFGYLTRRQDMVQDIVRELMPRMDVDSDGVVSMDDFLEWSRVHDLEGFVEDHASRAWDTARNCMDTM